MTNEKRLIDANALMDTVEGVNWYHIDQLGYLATGANSQDHTPIYKAEDIYNAIRKAPTVDAVEVVHGRWLQNIVNNHGIKHHIGFTASCCGRWSEHQTRYCPNCGAKMDGGNEDA